MHTGILMYIAWIWLVPTGYFFAAYMKPAMPKKGAWFQVSVYVWVCVCMLPQSLSFRFTFTLRWLWFTRQAGLTQGAKQQIYKDVTPVPTLSVIVGPSGSDVDFPCSKPGGVCVNLCCISQQWEPQRTDHFGCKWCACVLLEGRMCSLCRICRHGLLSFPLIMCTGTEPSWDCSYGIWSDCHCPATRQRKSCWDFIGLHVRIRTCKPITYIYVHTRLCIRIYNYIYICTYT